MLRFCYIFPYNPGQCKELEKIRGLTETKVDKIVEAARKRAMTGVDPNTGALVGAGQLGGAGGGALALAGLNGGVSSFLTCTQYMHIQI